MSVTAARVTRSTNKTIANDTVTVIDFDTEQYDTGGNSAFGATGSTAFHDNATNNSRLTAPVNGIYYIAARARWAASAVGRRELILLLNGATNIAVDIVEPVSEAAQPTRQGVTTDYYLAVGDYVEVRVRQTSGGDLVLQSSSPSDPQFHMHQFGTGPLDGTGIP